MQFIHSRFAINAYLLLMELFSFIVGVEIESKKFPIRYIVELLNKQGYTIVLTGIMRHGLYMYILHGR